MSLKFIVGKPGGGKSLTAVRLILRELEKPTGLHVVTNLPLRLGNIGAYLAKKVHNVAAVMDRITIVDRAAVKAFYNHAKGRVVTFDQLGNGTVEANGAPTLFVIDEVHLSWPSRDYRQTGPELLWYLTQHRKFGDEVYFVTQHPAQTDKALHRLAEEYLVSVNLSKRRLWGFRGPGGKFMVKTYFEIPNTLSKPAETIAYTFVLEEAECYDSSVGVGVSAGLADKGRVAKGLSPKWAVVALVGLAVGVAVVLYKGPGLLSKAILWVTGAGSKQSVAVVQAATGLVTSSNAPVGGPFTFSGQTGQLPVAAPDRRVTPAEILQGMEQGDQAAPGMVFRNKLVGRGPQSSVLANPEATGGPVTAYYIRGFDGRLHAVRIVRQQSEQAPVGLEGSSLPQVQRE